ncbi:MAG: TonB-dependent receptor plug domain-containing protein [Candidatus Kapabacteria bacterium]|nr:TonB-dependent receptor plug domain-containing protein [Candidatus Kapabacteria bacterium]
MMWKVHNDCAVNTTLLHANRTNTALRSTDILVCASNAVVRNHGNISHNSHLKTIRCAYQWHRQECLCYGVFPAFFALSLMLLLSLQTFAFTQTNLPLPSKTRTAPQFEQTTNATTVTRATITTNATTLTTASSSALQTLLQEKRNVSTASVRLFTPFREHGRMMITSTEAFITVPKRSVQWQDYTGLPDILAERLPTAFPLFVGLQGAYNHLSLLGAGSRDVAVMMNGRQMRSASLGATFLDQLPPEMAEQTEVFIGSEAVILANNASGAALNIQEVRHDTKNLFLRLWYQQFGDQFTAADVEISNNIAPNLNLTLGARTQDARRIYNNTGNRLWNARAILRWNPSSTASISLTYLLTSQQLAQNGGLFSTITSNTITSLPLFNELQENTLRHDLTLTGSAYLTPDSTLAATLSAFTTVDGRALVKASLQGGNTIGGGSVFALDETIAQSTSTNLSIGATGRIETRVSLFSALEASLVAGGTVALHTIPETIYWGSEARSGLRPVRTQGELTAFGRLGFTLLQSLEVSGGARLGVIGNRPVFALGAKASLFLLRTTTNSIQFWADASQSLRTPSLAEEGAARLASPTLLNSESHLLGMAGLRFRDNAPQTEFSAEALAFARLVGNPIVYDSANITERVRGITTVTFSTLSTIKAYNADSRLVLGASLTATWHKRNLWGNFGFVANGFVNGTLSQTNNQADGRFPLLYAGATAQVEITFGRDVLRAGVRVRAMTAFRGERFSPMLWGYIPGTDEQGLAGNGIDIVAGAEIFGNLFLRATYQNVLNSTVFTVAGYPQYPSVLRFTVSAPILGN